MKWLQDKHRVGTYAFALAAALAVLLFGWMLYNPPSKHENNPYNAYAHQYDSNSKLVPPPCVDPKSKTTRKCTQRENEKYYADRSALAAQWEASNKAHWGFYAGLLGLVLLSWTLYETLAASGQLRTQHEISLKTTKAEFQPYMGFSKKIKFPAASRLEHGIPTRIIVQKEGNRLHLKGCISITNKGKTPLGDIAYRCSGTMVVGDIITRININNDGAVSYVPAGGEEVVKILDTIHFDHPQIEDGDFNIVNMRINVRVAISFKDGFTEDKRRVFEAIYNTGTAGRNTGHAPVFLQRHAEVTPEPQDYPENWGVNWPI